jgi:hypothetical protein
MENSGPSILGNNKMATDPIKAKQSNIKKISRKEQESCEIPLKTY